MQRLDLLTSMTSLSSKLPHAFATSSCRELADISQNQLTGIPRPTQKSEKTLHKKPNAAVIL
jgi:hypothetical protein